MKKLMLLCLLIVFAKNTFAQKQTFDLTTFTPPTGWDKKEGQDAIQLSKHDEKSDSYCLITLYKSTPGTADSKENFDMAWTSLVKETITVSAAPEMQPAATENGWEIQSGHAPYESEGTRGVALLVTASAAEKMVNMIILTNTDVYEKEMTAFIESISLEKIETAPVGQPENPQQSTNTNKETFDLITYSPPKGWKKNVEGNFVSYIKTDDKTSTWCRINIVKSTISKGTIEADFENEWQELIVNNYKPTDTRKENEVQDADGWKIKAGSSKFTFDNKEAMAMLTTASGYDRCVSIVAVTNNKDYIKDVQELIASVDLIKPEVTPPTTAIANNDENTIIGTWLKTSTSNSNYSVNNGLHQYHKMQYEFKPNGTYNFLYRSFSYMPDIYFAKENGTYTIQGNTITIIPQTSVFETWSKGTIIDANGKEATVDKLGKLKSSQKRTLEKVTYQFTSEYFSGIKKWQLVLQYDKPTERDGPYNGGTAFSNAWLYGTAEFPIELK